MRTLSSRIDPELLALFLWDYFGPQKPRTIEQIHRFMRAGTPEQVAQYRAVAVDIVEQLEREQRRMAAQGIETATAAETENTGSVHESPVGNADAPE